MRQSVLFTKTRKEAPADEVARSAQLLLRGGFISKELAGVYSFLPLGLRVLNKIIGVIRSEMVALGGQEVSLTALQDPSPWMTSGRWSDEAVDVWFKTQLKNDTTLGLAFTHEEALTRLMGDHVSSYRDLPRYVFQFQTKFRNETRAKSGILRTREFVMKDLYSFSASMDDLDAFYGQVADSYKRIFETVGIGDWTYMTFASGGAFSKYSHEFQTICPAGEDTIFLHRDTNVAINQEVLTDEVLSELDVQREDLEEVKSIEVGNIFKLGTRYSEALGLTFTDPEGKQRPVVMGSYGIGPARVMATVVECLANEQGIVWPKAIAPFDVHIIEINPTGNDDLSASAQALITGIEQAGFSVLHDDREMTAGQKFADSDLIGIPTRVIVSAKTQEAGKFEVKDRANGEVAHLTSHEIIARLQS